MPKIAGEPLRKVTLNLFEADVDQLQRMCGQGYTEVIRDVVHRYTAQRANKEYEAAIARGFDCNEQ